MTEHSLYDFTINDKQGKPFDLNKLRGKVVLVVNIASKCGFTPQYQGLQELYEKYDHGIEILGFPCNQFGNQAPGTADEEANFCQANYGVKFPILQKVDVNGDNEHPIWSWLKDEKRGIVGLKRIKWNFEKFLIDKNGKVRSRFASNTLPASLKAEIDKLIV